ncbi:UNVERIFIED_CONTAM: hypothetical protein Sangu_2152200 [Sesamum angustifolium]|uniref:Uncharacterized protein n=1 Tax=Sesamum angustifolium TaxID=2727405 RepID=A0AAW2LFZ2_9LAMI
MWGNLTSGLRGGIVTGEESEGGGGSDGVEVEPAFEQGEVEAQTNPREKADCEVSGHHGSSFDAQIWSNGGQRPSIGLITTAREK